MAETALPPTPARPRFGAARSIAALLLREMEAQYGRNPGGYVWAIAQPVGMLLVITAAFSLIVRTPALGTSFVLFYATAFLPLQFFSDIELKVRNAIRPNRTLLSYPRVTWMDAVLARLILSFLTQAVVMVVVMTGILVVTGAQASLEFGAILGGVACCTGLGFGMGLVNLYLTNRVEVWGLIWSILSRPLVIAAGLFFIYEDLPQAAQDILYWSPLFHATSLVRKGFYPTYDATFATPVFMAATAGISMLLGLLLMRQGHRRVIDR